MTTLISRSSDDGDDAYAYPITTDMEVYGSGAGGGEPAARYISHGWTRSAAANWSMRYLRFYGLLHRLSGAVRMTPGRSTGETFFVYFTAEDQTGASA
ncbi:MAG: hypothetical protein ACLTYN_10615 [Dysosmobacter welbionis]